MGFRQVLVVGAFAFDQIWHRIQAQAVDAEIRPITQHRQDLAHHSRVVEIQVWLMVVESVPVIGFGGIVPGPVGPLRIHEDNACAGVFAVILRPDVEVPIHRARLGETGALEPRMLIRGMIDHQFRNDADAAFVGGGDEALYIRQGAVVRVDAAIVRDVVAIIQTRRRVKRQQPDGVHTQIGDIVQP